MRGHKEDVFQKPDVCSQIKGIFQIKIAYHLLLECLALPLKAPRDPLAGSMGSVLRAAL